MEVVAGAVVSPPERDQGQGVSQAVRLLLLGRSVAKRLAAVGLQTVEGIGVEDEVAPGSKAQEVLGLGIERRAVTGLEGGGKAEGRGVRPVGV